MENVNQPENGNLQKSTSAKIEGEELSYTGKGTGGDSAKIFRMKEEDERFIDNDSDVHDPQRGATPEIPDKDVLQKDYVEENNKDKQLQKDITAFQEGYGYATDQLGESSDESEEDGKI